MGKKARRIFDESKWKARDPATCARCPLSAYCIARGLGQLILDMVVMMIPCRRCGRVWLFNVGQWHMDRIRARRWPICLDGTCETLREYAHQRVKTRTNHCRRCARTGEGYEWGPQIVDDMLQERRLCLGEEE